MELVIISGKGRHSRLCNGKASELIMRGPIFNIWAARFRLLLISEYGAKTFRIFAFHYRNAFVGSKHSPFPYLDEQKG